MPPVNLFILTCSWRMENVRLFNILKVTFQQPVTIFLFFLSFCSPENFCWMLLSYSTSHDACALNRSCIGAGGSVFWGRSQQYSEMGSCWAVLWNFQILGRQAVWHYSVCHHAYCPVVSTVSVMDVYASVRFLYYIKASIFVSSINILGTREIYCYNFFLRIRIFWHLTLCLLMGGFQRC